MPSVRATDRTPLTAGRSGRRVLRHLLLLLLATAVALTASPLPTATAVDPLTISPGSLPSATTRVAYSQTLAATGGTAPYTFAVTGGAVPAGITLSGAGVLSGRPTVAGSFTFTVEATDSAMPTNTGSQSYTLDVVAPAIAIAPASLPAATTRVAYSQSLSATGGASPYQYAVTAGALPAGISLSVDGTLSGSTNTAGSFSFTVRATDADGNAGSQGYTFTVAQPNLTLSPPSPLPGGTVGVAYSQIFTSSGGTAPYTYAVTAGVLPAGMTLADGGRFSGTPTAGGAFAFTVTATDANGNSGSRAYTVNVAAPTILVAPAALAGGSAQRAYSQQLGASGGTAPYTFSISGTVPPGLTLAGSTLSGTPTVAGSFTFTVTARDSSTGGGPYSGSRGYTVTIQPSNESPSVSAGGAAPTFVQGGEPVALAPGLAVSDVDSTTLRSGQVAIASGFQVGDELGFVNQNGITGSYNTGTGVLTLSGTATLAAYQAALRSVTYRSTSSSPSTASRTVRFTVTDDSGLTGSADVTLQVRSVNGAPTVTVPPEFTVVEDQSIPLAGIRVADPDAGGADVAVGLTVSSGTLTTAASFPVRVDGSGSSAVVFSGPIADIDRILSNGGVIYAPAADSTATQTLTVVVDDRGNTGSGGPRSATGTARLLVTPVDDAPVVSPGGGQPTYTEGNQATPVAPALTVTDVDSATLASAQVSIVGGFASAEDRLVFTNQSGITGSYEAATGVLTLTGTATLAQYQAALRSVAYQNLSQSPSTATRTIRVTVTNDTGETSGPAEVAVGVVSVNDAPTLDVPAAYTVLESSAVALDGLGVDDVDAGTATITVRLSVPAGSLSATGTRGVTVTGSGTRSLLLTGAVADLDALLGAGGVTYRPVPGSTSGQTLSVVADDGGNTGTGGARTATGTSQLRVTAVDDPPTAVADDLTVAEDEVLVLPAPGVLANDLDPDTDRSRLTARLVDDVRRGRLTLGADGSVRYVPDAGTHGVDRFTYQVGDGLSWSAPATVSIVVTPVADAPTAADDRVSTDQDTAVVIPAADLLANDSAGPADEDQALRVTGVSGARGGSVVLRGDGSVLFTPARGFVGEAGFVYEVSDAGGLTDTATVRVEVRRVNATPRLAPIADRTVRAGSAGRRVVVRLSDPDDAAGSLDLAVASSDRSALPLARIDVEGEGARRVLVLRPLRSAAGSRVTVTVTVTDPLGAESTRSFVVRVVAPPRRG